LAFVENDLHQLDVCTVAILRMSRAGSARQEFERRRGFRDNFKWRTGSEGRINHLKRSYGWDRTHLAGLNSARTWCAHGVFAHNLVEISTLAAWNPRALQTPDPQTPAAADNRPLSKPFFRS
jgi:transposase, IS5 family